MSSEAPAECCFKNCIVTAKTLIMCTSAHDCCKSLNKLQFHHCCVAEFNVKFAMDEINKICPLCCLDSYAEAADIVLPEYKDQEMMQQPPLSSHTNEQHGNDVFHDDVEIVEDHEEVLLKGKYDVMYERMESNNVLGGGRKKTYTAWFFLKLLPSTHNGFLAQAVTLKNRFSYLIRKDSLLE